MDHCWGIVRALVDMLLKLEDGKYLLVKDPNKELLRLYNIPEVSGGGQEGGGALAPRPARLPGCEGGLCVGQGGGTLAPRPARLSGCEGGVCVGQRGGGPWRLGLLDFLGVRVVCGGGRGWGTLAPRPARFPGCEGGVCVGQRGGAGEGNPGGLCGGAQGRPYCISWKSRVCFCLPAGCL